MWDAYLVRYEVDAGTITRVIILGYFIPLFRKYEHKLARDSTYSERPI